MFVEWGLRRCRDRRTAARNGFFRQTFRDILRCRDESCREAKLTAALRCDDRMRPGGLRYCVGQEIGMSIFCSVQTTNGLAGLRDLTSADLPAILDYWLSSSVEFLDFMGVDRQMLGTEQDIRRRLMNAIRTGDASQPSISLAITLDDRFVGYTLLNRYAEDVNYSHWHITVPSLRAKGVSTALYPYRIKAYFDLTPISKLIHQTRTRNLGVNRMLEKFIPVSRTEYVEKPDGVAAPGEFHLRFVRREDIPRIFACAQELSGPSRTN